jgi:hypothetical protein
MESRPEISSNFRIWLNRFGAVLGFIGILFVLERLYTYHHELSFADWRWDDFLFLVFLCIAYGLTNIMLAVGWYFTLSETEANISYKWCIKTYAITQLAKYVPGNVFQLVSRQALGVASGISHSLLIKSAFLELLFLCGAASLVAPIFFDKFVSSFISGFGLMIFMVVLVFSIGLLTLYRHRNLVFAAASYSGHVLTSGLIFLGVFWLSGGEIDSIGSASTLVAGYIISWLIGILTPGAPAGIGVREAALVYLLQDVSLTSTVLAAAILSRTVTVTGDLLFYFQGNR